MPCQVKRRWGIPINGVATRAIIQVRCGGELSGVFVLVAVGAMLERNLEQRVLPLGNVTLRAFQLSVAALEWILGLRMLGQAKSGWLEPIHVVTGRALSVVRPLGKLPLVRIGLVAIHTLGEHQRFFEVATRMALDAANLLVFSQQWIFCLGVVKARA